ncbi:MAG: hypothetical protein KDH96_02405 [Candidatus Riesia sp.]|nr:hypothetical protein [Candidatus Riesia sp.]
MFLRGGLLIEPWKPFKSYTNDPRIQDVVLYDNTIYVCSETHRSGATFSENANKFISAGSSGSSGSSGGSSGFSFGGDWDATRIDTGEVGAISSFDVLHNATINGNVLTQILTGEVFGATATNLSHVANAGTLHQFRVTVPDISAGGVFFVGIHNSKLVEDVYSVLNDPAATVRGVSIQPSIALSFIRNTDNISYSILPHSVEAGDILKVGYRSDTSAVYIYNETQGNVQLIGESAISGFSDGLENITVYAQSAGSSLSFDFADDYPIYQSIFNFDYPNDLTKTYRVSAANANSVINGKLLKVNDFVDFITNEDDEVVDVVVSRLVSDRNIRDTISTALNNYNSSLSILVRDLGGTAGLDTVVSELYASLNDDNSTSLKMSLDDFLAYLLNNNASLFYDTFRTQVYQAVDAYIQDDIQNNGTLYNAIAQYVEDSTTGVNGHAAIQTAIEENLNNYADGIGVGANGQVYLDVYEAAQAAISNEIQSGGIIDTAIQAAVNP